MLTIAMSKPLHSNSASPNTSLLCTLQPNKIADVFNILDTFFKLSTKHKNLRHTFMTLITPQYIKLKKKRCFLDEN